MSDISAVVRSKAARAVALETLESSFALYTREADGKVVKTEHPFRPFIIVTESVLMNGFCGAFEIEPLEGDNVYRYMVTFASVSDFKAAKDFLKQATGINASAPGAPYLVNTDLVQQAMITSGIRLFEGMAFSDVRRMQFDIETLCDPAYDFSNPERESDAIAVIAMSDNTGWEKVVSLKDMTEKQLLEEFVNTVSERDPDILEGHNIFRFDLPYIEARAKRFKVKLKLGRDKSSPKKRPSRFNAAERTVNYTRYDIYGRHIADTYHLAVFYDISKRDLDSYGLKSIARHFGVASPERVYLDASDMNSIFAKNPEVAMEYCLDDVRETRAVADILSPSSFYQTRMIPLSYQNVTVRGTATKIDSVFLAEYVQNRCSIPAPEQGRPFAGALTDSFAEGVFDNVTHCDVRSLYPSIILSCDLSTSRDNLGVFTRYLSSLRTFRLEAKDAMKRASDAAERRYYSSLQSAFKILINSFYGYLGFSQGFLNDYSMAERVTARGREILTLMLETLRGVKANVIEMDTDGIYFQMPQAMAEDEMASLISSVLPDGIEVDFDETSRAMFAYKSKNYALLRMNGEVYITGAALKSRGLEAFQRDCIRKVVTCLLSHDPAGAANVFPEMEKALRNHELPLSELAKSETLSDSLDTYRRKQRSDSPRRSAAYELAIASGRDYRQGDQVSFYITGDRKKVSVVDSSKLLADAPDGVRDENVEYYVSKLEELKKKFSSFISVASSEGFEQTEFKLE